MTVFLWEPRRGGLAVEASWAWGWLKGHGDGSAYPGVSLHVGMQVRRGGKEKGAQDQTLWP